jgi:hypothetical protein
MLFTSFLPLLFKQPADDLIPIENELACRPCAEAGKALREVPLPHGPRGAAEEPRHLPDAERFA